MALHDALTVFRSVLSPEQFHALRLALLRAEGILVNALPMMSASMRDALGNVTLHEPAGFRRVETSAFEFRHDHHRRVSVATMRQIVAVPQQHQALPDCYCLLTLEVLSSIGRNIIVEHPRLCVWDRPVEGRLIYRHLEISDFVTMIDGLSQVPAPPPGRFAAYEAAGDVWDFLFVLN